jgi:Tfp pilus assembly protein PilF
MGKKAMDAGLAPEVARNAGAAAFVTGALMRIGPDSLRLDVRAQDAADGRVLFSEKVEGEDIKAVFRMVDALTARMAERLLPTGDLPGKAPVLEEVTTSNVEAYRHYQLGLEAVWRFEVTRALREFEEAVRLDPQFALAWLEIGKHCARFGPRRRSYEILRDLARQLSRLPRRSQLSLPGLRAWAGYDFDALRRAQEVLLAEFPRETNDRIRLSAAHLRFDRPLEAAEVVEEGLKLDPNDQFLWIQLSYCRVGTGDLPAALEASDRARALLPADPFPLLCRGEILFLAGRDEDAILAARKSLELGPYQDYIALWDLAFFYADQKKFPLAEANLREYVQRSQEPLIHIYEAHLEETRGRLDAARDLYRKAVARLAGDNPDNAGGALMALSHLSHAQGDGASALAFARQQQLDGEENLAISFLEAAGGDAAAAERSLQRYLQARPWLTEAAAGLWRARNQMAAALQRGEAKAVRSFTQPLPVTLECWIPVYQARAALLAADYPAAERLLRRTLFLERWLLTVSGLTQTRSPLVSLMCHYHLGQVHEATGKRDEASKEYHEFLSVFEGSAARLPQVAEARAALKRLGA